MPILFVRSLTRRLLTDNISFLAGGVAFYALLALFPALAAFVSIFGLTANPGVVQEQLESAQRFFPPDVYHLLHDQVLLLVSQSGATLSLTAIISILIALWSATRGTKAMLSALNMVFRVSEDRPWWLRQSLAYFITIGALLLMVLAIFVVVALPLLLHLLPDDITESVQGPISVLRWVLLGGAFLLCVVLLFLFGPNIKLNQRKMLPIIFGSVVTTGFWIIAAIGGSWIAQQIPTLQATYGSLSAVIALMLWMMASAYTVLFGAAVIATLETPRAPLGAPEPADEFR